MSTQQKSYQQNNNLSDIELVVISTKEFESLFTDNLGADRTNADGSKTSFNQKLKQVEYLFTLENVELFRYISTVRNIIVHDPLENRLRDRRKYESSVRKLQQGIVSAERQLQKAIMDKERQQALFEEQKTKDAERQRALFEEQMSAATPPKRGFCFIATAVYGDYDHHQVQVLRQYRDEHLLTKTFGRACVSAYYVCSPPIADWLRKHPAFAKPVKRVLDRIVSAIQK